MNKLSYLTDSERLLLTPALDEYIFTKDTRMLYYGDGETPGGRSVVEDELVKLFTDIDVKNNEITFNYDIVNKQLTVDASLLSKKINNKLTEIDRSISKIESSISAIDTSIFVIKPLPLPVNPFGHIDSPLNTAKIYTDQFDIITGNVETNPFSINLNASRGTTELPTDIQDEDSIANINFNAYTNGAYMTKASIGTAVSTNNSLDGVTNGKLGIFIKGNNTNSASPNQPGWYEYLFEDTGTFSAPIIQTGVYNGSANYPSLAKPGMIIFDCKLNQFFGYNGNEWKQLSD